MDIPKTSKSKNPPAKAAPTTPVKTGSPATPVPIPLQQIALPPLFRKIDWVALIVTFLLVFVVYYQYLAPEMTLEDSGELAVGSYYAGIPHPPGYPVWTLFTHLWTFFPFGTIAWRVGLADAFSGALACGLLAFIVSRGSSMIIESIDDLKNFDRRWENAICLVSGFVSGCLIGFNAYMWSQSVIVEVYPLSVLSLLGVFVCLLRWVYAPFQHRYLYAAFFLYGICVNNHQSLLVIAMGVEALIICAEPKLGREVLFWNTLIYLAGAILQPDILWGNGPVRTIYNVIGIASLAGWIWLVVTTKKKAVEFGRDVTMLATFGCIGAFLAGVTHHLPKASSSGALTGLAILSIAACAGFIWFIRETKVFSKEWLVTLGCGGSWLVGAAFYLYMPIAGATIPPMEWGYPRTLDGFIHALTRGQYEKIHPTAGVGNNFIEQTINYFQTFGTQIWRYMEGLNNEFNILYLLFALVVFLFYLKMKRRERVWIIGMVATFICLGPLLVELLNFPSDRQSLELNRVFLTSSHVIISMFIGFGLTLLATYLATHYASSRRIFMMIGLCVVDMAVFMLVINSQVEIVDTDAASILGYAKILCWLLAATSAIFLWREGFKEDRLLAYGVPGFFAALSLLPTILAFTKYGSLSAVTHGFSDAFKPLHYGLPVHAALVLIILGLVFLAALWLYRSKAPLAITLAVFAVMPSYSVLTHWFDNEQREHWFGYWFGHDMFTPPVVDSTTGKMTYDPKVREREMKGTNAPLIYPEMTRDTILFGGTDPGRFAPTYMIFCDSFIPHKCLPEQDQNFDRRDVYIITQNALADPTYLQYIRSHYFRSDEYQYDTPFFQEVLRGRAEHDKFSRYYDTTNILARLAYKFLDKPITELGAQVEARRRKEGVYPPKEIYTPNGEDSQQAFQDYMVDAQARIIHDREHPNEPRQVKNGEDVHMDNAGHVQVSGQIAVMSINGLLTKVIFDKNPDHEFFVEESFPLDWMFPHLTPFGVIMKINREPLPELSEEIIKRDHEFWAKYSERLIGNWITYDTPVKDIAAFAEKVYLRHDFTDFKGDRKFVRDDSGQKAFSKLRSSIAGIYSWRLGQPPSGGIMPSQYIANGPNRALIEREADFAYKQAFAFCPYSPEAIFRYVQLLANMRRIDDALLIAQTGQKLDPYNGQFAYLIDNLNRMKGVPSQISQIENDIARLETEVHANPNNFTQELELAQKYSQIGQNDRVFQVLDRVITNKQAPLQVVMAVAKAYNDLGQPQKLQIALERLSQLMPDSPEAMYDLAASYAMSDKTSSAMDSLKKAIDLSAKRRTQDPKATDLRVAATTDPRFAKLRDTPEFKALVATK